MSTILTPVPSAYRIPLASSHIHAGFPSPADDYIEDKLDLTTHLVQHPNATFYVRVTGESMIGAGINLGDLLSDIYDDTALQLDMLATEPRYSQNPKADNLMEVLDAINHRMGKGASRLAAEGLDGKVSWPMKRYRQSNRFTTNWEELLCARLQ